MNPSHFGKVIDQIDNKFIIQLTTTNVAIIKQLQDGNFVKLFRKGELIFEFKDSRISENTFSRTILDTRFTFKDSKLIKTEIMSVISNITIYANNLNEIKYTDTDSILSNKLTPFENMIRKLEKSQYAAEYFGLFTLFLMFLT